MAAKKKQEDKEIKRRKPRSASKKAAANTSPPKKQAGEALPKSEDRYRTLVEKAFEGIIVIQDGEIVFANPRAYAIIGYPRDQVAPRAFMDFIHPDDAEILTDNYLRRLKGEQFEETYPIRLFDQKGNIKWAQISTSLINWEGKPATLTFLTDITERNRVDKALLFTRFSLDNAADTMVCVDREAHFIDVNETFCRACGYSREELLSMKVHDLDPEYSAEAWPEFWGKLKKSGSLVFETYHRSKKGELYPVEISASYFEHDGKEYHTAVARDITERKKSEEALKASEAQYRLLADNMRDQVWVMDLNLKPTYISPSVEKLRGYTLEELAQLPLDRQFTAASFQSAMEFFSIEMPKAEADPEYFARPLELEWCCKDGSTLWVESTFSQVRDENGEPMFLVGVGRDITERKRAEDEVRRQQAFLRQVIDSSPNLIFVKDRDSRYLLANNTLANGYGTTPAYMQGKTDLELGVPAEEFARFQQDDVEVLQSGKEKIIPDESFTWQSGEVHYYQTTKRPLLDENGEINSILAVSVDITDRKQAEEALRKSEEKYRLLADNASDVIWTADMNLNTTYISPSIYAMQGHTPEEAMNLTIEQRFTPESLEKVSKVFMEAVANEESGREQPNNLDIIEAEYIRKDGSTYWTETKASFIRDGAGKVVGILGVTRDISERKKAERALALSEERYRTILENMHDSYIEVDLTGNFTFVNEATCCNLGYSMEELIGHNFSIIAPGQEEVKAIFEAYNRVYKTGEPYMGFAFKAIRKDRSTGYAEISISLIKNAQGRPIGFRGVGRDVTERKQLEQKLEEMATHDFLTGLPNRLLLIDRFNIVAALAHRNKARLAVMSLDLDNFKSINDTLGHDIGDQVLKAVSSRFTEIIRASDTVARVGGDEFILVMLETKHMEDATAIAQKILDSFIEPLSIDGHQLHLSSSIGIAIYPEDAEDMETLIKKSDAAMYYSKGHGGNQFKFYGDGYPH